MRHKWIVTAVLLAPLCHVEAADLPKKLQAGLWDVSIASDVLSAPVAYKMCLDSSPDWLERIIQSGTLGSTSCTKADRQASGSQLTVDSVCTVGQSQVTSHAVATLEAKSYKIEVHSHNEPAIREKTDSTLTQTANWSAGKCPSDMKPGDIKLPNGQKVQIGGS
jgi:Protein of unknown function (DUF3617)